MSQEIPSIGRAENLSNEPRVHLAHELIDAVQSPDISKPVWFASPKNLYLNTKQAEKYLDLMKLDDYSTAFHDAIRESMDQFSAALIAELQQPARIFDLGPGFPDKTIPLIKHLRVRRVKHQYVPVDISRHFLNVAIGSVLSRFPGIPVWPLHCLFEDLPNAIAEVPEISGAGTRIILLGLTFMNFDAAEILPVISSLMRKGDVAIIAMALSEPDSSKNFEQPYRNEIAKQFNFSALEILGFKESDFSYFVRFRNNRVEMGFVATQPLQLNLGDGLQCEIQKNREIITAISYRYTPSKAKKILEQYFSLVQFDDSADATLVSLRRPRTR